MDWLINLTQPQATLGAAAFTFVGAIIAVILGWLLFSAKVKGFQSALGETEKILTAHQSSVAQTLADIEAKISGLAERAGKLSADIGDRQAETEDGQQTETEPLQDGGPANNERDPELFPALASAWHTVRDILEQRAADQAIDGRTAAKYQRKDRRNYSDLINAMANDGRLPEHDLFREAAQIWGRYRTRRMAPTPQDTTRIEQIAADLAGSIFN